jgi:hypothetical protein
VFLFAKCVQAMGFADVGYGLYLGMTREGAMGKELELALVGVAIFYVGRLLERWA